MPVIHVNVWEGFGPQKAKAAIEGITQVLVDLGIPQHAVEVLVHEIPKTHWGSGGEPASEWGSGGPAAKRGAQVQEAGSKKPAAGVEQL